MSHFEIFLLTFYFLFSLGIGIAMTVNVNWRLGILGFFIWPVFLGGYFVKQKWV